MFLQFIILIVNANCQLISTLHLCLYNVSTFILTMVAPLEIFRKWWVWSGLRTVSGCVNLKQTNIVTYCFSFWAWLILEIMQVYLIVFSRQSCVIIYLQQKKQQNCLLELLWDKDKPLLMVAVSFSLSKPYLLYIVFVLFIL